MGLAGLLSLDVVHIKIIMNKKPRYDNMEEFLAALSPETRQAVIDAEQGKNLVRYGGIDELFESFDEDD